MSGFSVERWRRTGEDLEEEDEEEEEKRRRIKEVTCSFNTESSNFTQLFENYHRFLKVDKFTVLLEEVEIITVITSIFL